MEQDNKLQKILYLPTHYVKELETDDPTLAYHQKRLKGQPWLHFRHFPNAESLIIDIVNPDKLPLFNKLNLGQAVKAYLWQHSYDFLIAGGLRSALILGLLRALFSKSNTPLVVWDYRGFHKTDNKEYIVWLIKKALKGIDLVFYTSSSQMSHYQRVFPEELSKFKLVTVGLDPSQFQNQSEEVTNYCLSFGYEDRDLKTLLKAWRQVKNQELELLIITGDRIDDLPPRVKLLPPQNFAKFNQLLAKARFVILPLPDREHSYGQVSFLHAAVMKKAVIISEVLGVKDYLKDDAAYLKVPPADSQALAEKIDKLAADSFLAKQLGEKARSLVKNNFNEKQMARQVYEYLLNLGKPKRRKAAAPIVERNRSVNFEDLKKVSIIIVTYNSNRYIHRLLSELITPGLSAEIIVIDNGSIDGTAEVLRRQWSSIKIITNTDNIGFSRAVNQGARLAQGEYLFLLNPDCLFKLTDLKFLIDTLKAGCRIAAVCPQTLNPDYSLQPSFGSQPTIFNFLLHRLKLDKFCPGGLYCWPNIWNRHLFQQERSVAWVAAGAILIKRSAFESVGGFDEGYFLYVEDIDFSNRLREQGWQLVYQPQAKVIHWEKSSSRDQQVLLRHYLFKSWQYYWQKQRLKSYQKLLLKFFQKCFYFFQLPVANFNAGDSCSQGVSAEMVGNNKTIG